MNLSLTRKLIRSDETEKSCFKRKKIIACDCTHSSVSRIGASLIPPLFHFKINQPCPEQATSTSRQPGWARDWKLVKGREVKKGRLSWNNAPR